MCGRATLTSPAEEVAELFEAPPIDIGPARYNIAPTQPILTVRSPLLVQGGTEEPGRGRELALVRWGLVPWWAKPGEAKRIASKCIQARAETAPSAPAFRDAFRRHRCLVIVDGFFEWKTLPDGRRVPHHVRRGDKAPFAIAGLWDQWRSKSETEPEAGRLSGSARTETDETETRDQRHATEVIESAAVLTTRAGGVVRDLHDRMPLILPANDWDTWLEGSTDEAEQLLHVDRARSDERAHELLVVPVSTWVNDAKHDDPRCIEPIAIERIDEPRGQIDFAFAGPVKGAPAKRVRHRRP